MRLIMKNIILTFKWMMVGILLGVLGGVLGACFHIGLDFVTMLRENNGYLLCFLPLGGVVIAFMYNKFRDRGNIDIKRVFQAVRENKDIPFVMIPLIFAGTLITHMFGGSAGREGAALQLGGSMGYNLAKKLKWDHASTKLMVTAGMSSVFSALFGVPLAATVFSLEVTKEKGMLKYSSLLTGLVASLVAFFVAQFMGVEPVRFDISSVFKYQVSAILKVFLIALLCGGVCILFASAIHKSEFLMKKYIPNCYARAVTGGLLIVFLTMVLKTTDYNGAGMSVIINAISGEAKNSAFLIKIVFTAITVAAGFKGGEIVPTFFIGATFGCCISSFIGFTPELGASLGLIAMFAGMTKCPVAAFLMAVEVFGAKALPLFAIAIIIAFVFSGRFGLYENVNK